MTIVHLIRSFSGVLNSSKKTRDENLKEGREYVKKSAPTYKTFFTWMVTNLAIVFFSIRGQKVRVFYEKFLECPPDICTMIVKFRKELCESDSSVIHPYHVFAGNRNRMQSEITIKKSPEKYKQLSSVDKKFAGIIDALFYTPVR